MEKASNSTKLQCFSSDNIQDLMDQSPIAAVYNNNHAHFLALNIRGKKDEEPSHKSSFVNNRCTHQQSLWLRIIQPNKTSNAPQDKGLKKFNMRLILCFTKESGI